VCLGSDADKTQTDEYGNGSAQLKDVRFSGGQFRVHRSCPLSTSFVSEDKQVVQSVSQSVLQQRRDSRNEHRIRNRLIVSLDILIALTLCNLALLLSGAEFGSCDRIHFQTQPRYMVCKTHFPGALLSRSTQNASETQFQMPKPEHMNVPNMKTSIQYKIPN